VEQELLTLPEDLSSPPVHDLFSLLPGSEMETWDWFWSDEDFKKTNMGRFRINSYEQKKKEHCPDKQLLHFLIPCNIQYQL
jgi:hypothetical protein